MRAKAPVWSGFGLDWLWVWPGWNAAYSPTTSDQRPAMVAIKPRHGETNDRETVRSRQTVAGKRKGRGVTPSGSWLCRARRESGHGGATWNGTGAEE